jgi:hypothetical protein
LFLLWVVLLDETSLIWALDQVLKVGVALFLHATMVLNWFMSSILCSFPNSLSLHWACEKGARTWVLYLAQRIIGQVFSFLSIAILLWFQSVVEDFKFAWISSGMRYNMHHFLSGFVA